jgi:hypothetical protein
MIKYLKRQVDTLKRWREKRKAIKEQTKHIHTLTLREILAEYLQSKLPSKKQSAEDPNAPMMPAGQVNHIAIVLDGKVEDVIRAQNRMTALLLSQPEFVDFDPKLIYPILGVTEYVDGEFVNAREIVQHKPAENMFDDFNLDDYLKDQES